MEGRILDTPFVPQERMLFCQSAIWGRMERSMGAVPISVISTDNGGKKGQCLLLRKHFIFPLGKYAPPFLSYLEATDGPLTNSETGCLELQEQIIRKIDRYARRHFCYFMKFHRFGPSCKDSAESIRTLMDILGYKAKKWATRLIDLTVDESSLWRGLTSNARNKVRRSQKMGTRVFVITNVKDLHALYVRPFKQIKGYTYDVEKEFQLKLEIGRGQYHFLVALDPDGATLATLGITLYNGLAQTMASALSPGAYKKRIPAQDLLHWEIIMAAKRLGCHTLDMGGFSAGQDISLKEKNIRVFKEKWGGEYHEFYHFGKYFYPKLHKSLSTALSKTGKS